MNTSARRSVDVVAVAMLWSCVDAIAESLPPSVRTCSLERDDQRRLSCYDKEIAALFELDARPHGEHDRESAQARFGISDVRAPPARRDPAEHLDRIEATVVAATTRKHGAVVVTLDSGQVWAQKSAGPVIRINIGDRVVIKKATLGSFLLIVPNHPPTRVRRER